ncbi:winged helix-turn-helix domain-containing protein [Nocardia sp. CC227C]|uniref:helix-turn-helix domain-containing protein n=1 Tax=Nocardia sp. CC227C TaxID=3044562 RepID=UPI00278BE946|nr:winged helix-turn-helix domain-containing protein [Nocardia sp. CC227C]
MAALLDDGPAAHGWVDDPRWTLTRVCELVTRHFGYTYSLRGMSLLLHRLGFSPQVRAHRAAERDEESVATWIREDWLRGKGLPARRMRGSASRTKQVKASAYPKSEPGAGAGTPR